MLSCRGSRFRHSVGDLAIKRRQIRDVHRRTLASIGLLPTTPFDIWFQTSRGHGPAKAVVGSERCLWLYRQRSGKSYLPAHVYFVLTSTLGIREYVRLLGQNNITWTQWDRKVSLYSLKRLRRHLADSRPRSCLLHRFVKNEWRTLSSQTIGVEFASKIIRVGTGARRKRIKLQVLPFLIQIIPEPF
jgi:hypothetical protein